MENKQLYRPGALNARGGIDRSYGSIALSSLPSYWVICVTAAIILIVLFSILIFGSYTRRATVAGELRPEKGVVLVFAPKTGRVSELRVREGDNVKAGETLFVIFSDQYSSDVDQVQLSILESLSKRRQSLAKALSTLEELNSEELDALNTSIHLATKEVASIEEQLSLSLSQVALAKEELKKYNKLLFSGLVRSETVMEKRQSLIAANARRAEIEGILHGKHRELDKLKREFLSVPKMHEISSSEIERKLQSISEEIAEARSQRIIFVTSPIDGVVGTVNSEAGQIANDATLLAALLPSDTKLQGVLYIPGDVIGLVEVGMPVEIRYEAFPYQKFGQAKGKITSISEVPWVTRPPWEHTRTESGGSQYKATVDLYIDYVQDEGRAFRLKPGMKFEASVTLERKRLYQLLF